MRIAIINDQEYVYDFNIINDRGVKITDVITHTGRKIPGLVIAAYFKAANAQRPIPDLAGNNSLDMLHVLHALADIEFYPYAERLFGKMMHPADGITHDLEIGKKLYRYFKSIRTKYTLNDLIDIIIAFDTTIARYDDLNGADVFAKILGFCDLSLEEILMVRKVIDLRPQWIQPALIRKVFNPLIHRFCAEKCTL